MSASDNSFTPTGWISGYVKNTLEQDGSIYISPGIPVGTTILSLTILPIHIYSNDPHPEPFPGLTVNFAAFGREFLIRADPYDPRDSIQFFEWQVTYGTAPSEYTPIRWVSGATKSADIPQLVEVNAPSGIALNGLTVLPIHVYDNDPNPEPWPALDVDFTDSGNFWLYSRSGGEGPRDSINWFLWQGVLGPTSTKPSIRKWTSGYTKNAQLPMLIAPSIPEGKGIVSVDVFPIHVYDNDPKPEWWPALRVTFPTPQTFEIKEGEGEKPRDKINWFLWQVAYSDLS